MTPGRAALLLTTSALAGALAVAVVTNQPEAPQTLQPRPAIVDPRDQYALVQEIQHALHKRPSEMATALDEIRSTWQGRRYRWDVALVPALCRTADTCVAMPFDHLRHPELDIVQGWLPRLDLTADTHAALLRDCEPHHPCVFTFEGELDRFVLDPQDPTSIGFADVQIASIRAATPDESWIRRPRHPRALSGNPNVVGHRTPMRAEQG
jgi:hypothetical protein